MADIRRETQDVSPNNFTRQGVQDNSAAMLVGGLVDAGLKFDAGLAQEKLGEDVNELTAQYLASSPASQVPEDAGQQAVEAELSPFRAELRKGAAAKEQGKMSYQQFQVRVERATREAIARRPGLANEFRQISASFSGGPAVDWLMRQEAAMLDQAKTAAQKQQEEKQWLQKQRYEEALGLGITIPPGSSLDEADAYIIKHQDNIDELRRAKQQAASTKLAAEMSKDEQVLIQPTANQAFITEGRQILANGWNDWQSVSVALDLPNVDAAQKVQIMAGGVAKVDQMLIDLRTSASKYNVDEATVETFSSILKNIQQGMKDYTTATVEEQQNIVNGIKLNAQFLQIQNPDVAALQAMNTVFDSNTLGQMFAPGGVFHKQAYIVANQALQGTATPEATMKYAGPNTGNMTATLFDKATEPATPEQLSAYVTFQNNNAAAFIGVDDSKWNANDWAGNNGWIANLRLQKENLFKNLPVDEKVELSKSIAMAANNGQRVVASRLFSAYPGLRGKVDVYLDPDTGRLFHPAGEAEGLEEVATWSATERQAVNKFEAQFGGKNIIDTISTLTDFNDAQKATAFIYDFQYAAAQARKPAAVPKNKPSAAVAPAQEDYTPSAEVMSILEMY